MPEYTKIFILASPGSIKRMVISMAISQKSILSIILVILACIFLTGCGEPEKSMPGMEISSYEECAKAGGKIYFSDPPKCETPDGSIFVGEVEDTGDTPVPDTGDTDSKDIDLKDIQSFQDCINAGYPILESYPAQCRTPDGRRFVDESVPKLCRIDFDCKPGFYCEDERCVGYSIDKTCLQDSDCQLINEDARFSCCYIEACIPIDYSEEKWVSANVAWFEDMREQKCPSKEECGPAPLCAVRAVNENFEAKCDSGECVKVPI